MAEHAEELRLLRAAVFQAVPTQHCQAQAVQRINALMPFFRQVLPARLLTHVRSGACRANCLKSAGHPFGRVEGDTK